jgi:glycosyltransferase involved in cell wall biosynthesis
MHEYWLVCPTHVLFSFNRAPCTQPRCFRCSLTYKRPPQWWRYLGVLDAAIKHVDVFLAPSRFCKDLHQRMGLNAPIVHLPNFVPAVDGATPPTAGQPVRAVREDPQKPYFLFVGRLEKLKGLQTLLPIFRRYHKAQLFVAGTGSEESRLRQCVGDSANIHFLGYLSDRQLQALYQQAVAVIIPSVWYENFPLVIIEAFRQRTPVIVRNLGGMLEIVAESGGGFVYETDEELVAALTCRPPACAKWFLGFRTRFRERLCRIPRRTRA